jgi:predicted ATPase
LLRAASLDLLHYLARVWAERGAAVLILLTLRTEARQVDPSLEAWVSSLERNTILVPLSLVPLTARETTQLAEKLVGEGRGERTPSAFAFADWLFRETAGQPLFIAESLKTLLEQGVLQLQTDAARQSTVDLTGLLRFAEGQALPLRGLVPAGVRQMIVSRLERLTPTARTLLTAAAVLGRDCDFAQLCRVTDLSERDALPALDELLSSQLLQERIAALLPYRFGHDKIREVVYTEASDARRRMYHRNAVALLKDADAPAADIAHHALAARLLEPAFQYSVAAGDAAMALFALPNAIAHYEQARALIASPPTANGAIHHLYAQLSRAYELQDEYARAAAIAEEMLAQARATQQPRMACAALNRLASLAIYSQQIERANALLAEAREIAEKRSEKHQDAKRRIIRRVIAM